MNTVQSKFLLLVCLSSFLTSVPMAHAATRGFFAAKAVVGAYEDFVKKVAVKDFNNDGKIDFATLSWEIDDRCNVQGEDCGRGFVIAVYLNTTSPGARDPSFQLAAKLPYIHSEYRQYPVWANDMLLEDVNDDDVPDIVVANAHNDAILTFLGVKDARSGKGTGQFNLPVETIVDDDPTYIAAGHFLVQPGLKQLVVEHYRRGRDIEGSDAYDFKQNIYQFKDDGSLAFISQVQNVGAGGFSGAYNGHVISGWENLQFPDTPYYTLGNYTLTVIPAAAAVTYPYREAIPIGAGNDVLESNRMVEKWWTYAHAGEIIGGVIEANTNMVTSNFSRADRHVFMSGNIMGELDGQSQLWQYRNNNRSLDSYLQGIHILKPSASPSLAFPDDEFKGFGVAVIAEDFDRDGQVDLALLSGANMITTSSNSDHASNTDQAIMVAYSDLPIEHPLNIDINKGFDADRIKILGNASGRWHEGIRDWRWAVGDFNGDKYPDLLTVTDAGIMIHTNYGNFAQDAAPPVLQDLHVEQKTVDKMLVIEITANGQFYTGDRLANWIEVTDRSMGRNGTKYLLMADPNSLLDPFDVSTPKNNGVPQVTQMRVTIPRQNLIAGIYEARVTNTLSRSTRSFSFTIQ